MSPVFAYDEEVSSHGGPLQVGVFCSADDKISTQYKKLAHYLGQLIAENKWGLVTGGSRTGLMKEVIDGYTESPHHTDLHSVKGILPTVFKEANIHHPKIKENNLLWTDSVHLRLASFQDNCDALVFLPGGFGTLHELMDFLVHNQFGLMKKKIILVNINHYWDPLLQQFKVMSDQAALHKKHLEHLKVVTDINQCLKLIKTSSDEKLMQGVQDRYWEKENKRG